MKIIKIDGCAGCHYSEVKQSFHRGPMIFCNNMDIFMVSMYEYSKNYWYIHPDCPLEEMEEKGEK